MRRLRCTIYVTNIHFKFQTGSTIYCFYGRVVLFISPHALSMNNFLNSWCAPGPVRPAGAKYFWFVYRSEKCPRPKRQKSRVCRIFNRVRFLRRTFLCLRPCRAAVCLVRNCNSDPRVVNERDCFRQLHFGQLARDDTTHKQRFIFFSQHLCLNGFFDNFNTSAPSMDFGRRTRYDRWRETVDVAKRLKTPKLMIFTYVLIRLNGRFVARSSTVSDRYGSNRGVFSDASENV